MASVVERIKQIKQPYGGYLPVQDMDIFQHEDNINLYPDENVQPFLVGLAVDYLTRVMLGDDPKDAFEVSLYGIAISQNFGLPNDVYPVGIPTDLSDISIKNAVLLASFDSFARAGPDAYQKPVKPNQDTTENIRMMVERSVYFFTEVYPMTQSGFTFEGGYTDAVHAGDGDILTETGLWDMKVLRGDLTSKHTLQLLMYWRMGLHSIHPVYQGIETLGFYNPRKNEETIIHVGYIPEDIWEQVDRDVIGYKEQSYEPICACGEIMHPEAKHVKTTYQDIPYVIRNVPGYECPNNHFHLDDTVREMIYERLHNAQKQNATEVDF